MTTKKSARRPSAWIRAVAAPILMAGALSLAACGEELQHGYVLSQDALSQIQVGSSREQVLLVLGSPSTTATLEGEAFYYISSKTARPVNFMNHSTVDQRVLAVYFDDKSRVREIGNYGLQDGKVFDFISRKTKTGGADINLLGQILKASSAIPTMGGG